ncbi:toll/interleukin-1 receptor domain-containing protein [Aliarcobacter butzleri]|uniref:toll/interleukin-1 receptor domain-containing protein n=1 Tax=Aliarcobacter butzleri TaxID=28197 RepID=UPI0021B368CE|nr:toll/interleukin-1 receptor domain-containing protein [Aliarcobacter butzleri]MCT7577661.1 toll/interleukin-1 receptor domain-containing protein [Aliarcobacter butzleri]
MTTVREYFDTDKKAHNAERKWNLNNGNTEIEILCKLSYKLEDKIKLFSFFFPKYSDFNAIKFILDTNELKKGKIDEFEHIQTIKFLDNPEGLNLSNFFFVKNIFLYIDRVVSDKEKVLIINYGKKIGFNIFIRDKKYALECHELSTPLAFISHAFVDKDSLVRTLANELRSLNCPVWYDEYTLEIGDNMIEKFNEGIKNTKYSIVVLSKSYIDNTTWASYEFKKIIEKEDSIIIPIWYGVSKNEVENFYPGLSSIFGESIPLSTECNDGNYQEKIINLAKKLELKIKKEFY